MEIERNRPGHLEFPSDVERLENGNTLITDAGDETGAGSEVIEVDALGNLVWRYSEGLAFAHSAKRLENGNTLISDTSHDRVIEVSSEGQIVFSSDDWGGGSGRLSDGSHLHYPNDAHDLGDGRLMITDRNNNRCLIVNREGVVDWFYDEEIQHPHNCDLLPSGHVLIADSDRHRVIEVNPAKEIVWWYDGADVGGLNWPRDADRLEDGATLIADSKNGRLLKVNPQGKMIWKYEAGYFANFYDADPLPNGNVLVSDQQHHQVLEIDPSGTVVWQYRNYRTLHPVWPRLKNGSFKEIGEDGLPAHWMLYRRFSEGGGEFIWDETAQPRPAPGVSFDRAGALCLFQVIAAKPGTLYKLAGSIKTAEMAEGSVAYFQIAFMDQRGGLLCDAAAAPKGALFTENTDWTQDTLEAVAPEKAVAAEIRLFISGKGKVWMKGLMVFS